MALKRKAMASAAALALVALIATGTFAWTSLNSQKLNEWFGTGTKPGTTAGGTLHDDHDNDSPADPNKQVYIENWGDKPLFVRIRLDEYMEVGEGAGKKTYEPNEIVKAYSFIPGAKLNDPKTWKTHIPKASEPNMCGFDDTAGQGDFHEYWEWQMGGQKFYYPAPEGSREDKDFVAQGSPADLTAGSADVKRTLSATVLTMEQ